MAGAAVALAAPILQVALLPCAYNRCYRTLGDDFGLLASDNC